jgi:2Fe-2S ferredoxin
MGQIHVTLRDGRELVAKATEGSSVMEVIRDAGGDGFLALCGGCCSCATCHVYIADNWRDKLSPMSHDENDLLETFDHRNEGSRLSCQINYTAALNGLRLVIAQED